MTLKLLNIACGSRYHKKWINIDFHSISNDVKKVNVLCGLPFEENSIDHIYCSHFIEHLTPEQAEFLLIECLRVLKIGGVIRRVVPDLENICREYLYVLEIVQNDESLDERYNWIVIELLDQLVRTYPGGKMGEIYREVSSKRNAMLAEYIYLRVGEKLLHTDVKKINMKILTLDRIKNKLLYLYLKVIRFLIPKNLRDLVFFNTSIGERHQWMYDKYSLSKLLKKIGFSRISIKTYNTSDIPEFNSYFLDINEDGTPAKGISSLYIEAIK